MDVDSEIKFRKSPVAAWKRDSKKEDLMEKHLLEWEKFIEENEPMVDLVMKQRKEHRMGTTEKPKKKKRNWMDQRITRGRKEKGREVRKRSLFLKMC